MLGTPDETILKSLEGVEQAKGVSVAGTKVCSPIVRIWAQTKKDPKKTKHKTGKAAPTAAVDPDAAFGSGSGRVSPEVKKDLVPGSKAWRDEIQAWKHGVDKGIEEYEKGQKRMKRKERYWKKKYQKKRAHLVQ